MDLNILFYLQNVRETLPDVVIKVIHSIADFPAGILAILVVSIVYWSFNKKSGSIILGSYVLSYFINGLLKVTACVYRPWIRDSRLHIAAIAEKGATGYSFPSGHATTAGSLYTATAFNYSKKARWITPVCVVLILFTMFARCFVGAHTPQDVIVGAITGVISVLAMIKIAQYANNGDKELKIVFIATVVITIVSVVYIILKPYPMDVDATGAFLADPAKMMKDSVKGAGMFFGYVIGVLIEKKKVGFKDTNDKAAMVKRAVIGTICVLVLYIGFGTLAKKIFGEIAGAFVEYTLTFTGITGIVPLVFKKLKLDEE